ncbi:hypothetical protein Tco_1427551 [Tanacetum coccineum]
MFVNLDQLEKHLSKEEFQELEFSSAFRVLLQQFQTFLYSRFSFDIDEVKRGKVYSSKALDAGLVVMESNETESERHVSSSRSGKDTHAEDADINSVNDKQPMAEVQLFAEHNIRDKEQQHSEQSESVYDTYVLEKVDRNTIPKSTDMSHRGGEIDQNADDEKCQVSCPLLDPSFDNMTTKFSNQFLESENISLKKTVAQLQKDFLRMETHCVNLKLKYQNQVLKNGQHGQILNETSNKAKIKKEIETYKDLYDSIKKTRVQTKDHNDSLIAKINSKTVENANLKAQWKRISDKRTKNQAKTDKTEHETERAKKAKVKKSKSKPKP